MGKKTILWVLLAIGVTCSGQGCAGVDIREPFVRREADMPGPAEVPELWTETEGERQDGAALQPEEISGLYYAYHSLDTGRQQVYREMLGVLAGMKDDARLSTVDSSVLEMVFACVMNDHPELFYVEGYRYTEYTFGGTVTGITFSGTYSIGREEARQTGLAIEQELQECFSRAPLDGDEYGMVRFLYEWLIDHTEYDKAAENNQDIRSVFLQGRSICQGYAKAMQYMLQKADIQCLLVTGSANGDRHGWNMVRVNGEYYYLDPTWGDASYASNGGGGARDASAPPINYDYFLVTTEEIERTHTIEEVVGLPRCTAVRDNYFVREGLYFENYDSGRLAAVFNSEASKAAGYVTIKCGSGESYADMVGNLIDRQRIFDFVNRQALSIAYTSNEKQRTISFWNIYR